MTHSSKLPRQRLCYLHIIREDAGTSWSLLPHQSGSLRKAKSGSCSQSIGRLLPYLLGLPCLCAGEWGPQSSFMLCLPKGWSIFSPQTLVLRKKSQLSRWEKEAGDSKAEPPSHLWPRTLRTALMINILPLSLPVALSLMVVLRNGWCLFIITYWYFLYFLKNKVSFKLGLLLKFFLSISDFSKCAKDTLKSYKSDFRAILYCLFWYWHTSNPPYTWNYFL